MALHALPLPPLLKKLSMTGKNTCLVTGGAGFIGSSLVRALLLRDCTVRVLDDFSSGRPENLKALGSKLSVIEGSLCDPEALREGMRGVRCCFHLGAIPSVPRSLKNPLATNRVNVEGTLQVLETARELEVGRVIIASSSSVYGNARELPLGESLPLNPISPYGVSKAAAELYARCYRNLYGLDVVVFRYFNVFGPRQDPASAYAAVIPRFFAKLLSGEPPVIFGDGLQARDFTYVDNVVQANLLACDAEAPIGGVYNIACGSSTSVLNLARMANEILGTSIQPRHEAPRAGDILNSCADITQAWRRLGYEPLVGVREGLEHTAAWLKEAL